MTYRVEELDDRYAGTKLTTLPRDLNDRLLGDVRLDEYQEPFHENKYRASPHAAYYGYSTVVVDNKDLHDNVEQSGESNSLNFFSVVVEYKREVPKQLSNCITLHLI